MRDRIRGGGVTIRKMVPSQRASLPTPLEMESFYGRASLPTLTIRGSDQKSVTQWMLAYFFPLSSRSLGRNKKGARLRAPYSLEVVVIFFDGFGEDLVR